MPAPRWLVVATLALACGVASGKPGDKDWIDSPLIGSGNAPANTTTKIYFSAYLDRIIEVNEQSYTFSASFYVYLSWRDPDAPAAVAAATADAAKPGNECARYCDNTKVPGDDALCCSTLFVPSLVLRNVFELPQGRVQPTAITVSPSGVVSVRCMIRCDAFTTLDVRSFPFDVQGLAFHFTINSNTSAGGDVEVVPSAAGIKLFTGGAGDDTSGWRAEDVHIFASSEPYYTQFDDPRMRNSLRPSARDDPAPLVPAPGVDTRPYGTDIRITSVALVLIVRRLSLYFGVSTILPVVVCTLISLITFHVDPDNIDTRLQVCMALFLSLVAVQYITEATLPRASYVIPTRALVILSYCVLLLISIETIIVYNILNRNTIRARTARMRSARLAHEARLREVAAGARGADRFSKAVRLAIAHLPAPGERQLQRALSRLHSPTKPAARADSGLAYAGVAGPSALEQGAPPRSSDTSDLDRGYAAWVAHCIDRVSFWSILVLYVLSTILIFTVSYLRAPDVCDLSGVEDTVQCAELRSRAFGHRG